MWDRDWESMDLEWSGLKSQSGLVSDDLKRENGGVLRENGQGEKQILKE